MELLGQLLGEERTVQSDGRIILGRKCRVS